jgi:UDP-GlcNAc:undecaprenyl-phosphate GlcNAc-1-phosphate transferase
VNVLLSTSFAAAVLVSLALVGAARWLFRRIDFVDRPGHRKVHERATPYGGGAGVMATLLVVLGGGFVAVHLVRSDGLAWLPARDVLVTHADGVMSRAGDLGGLLAAAGLLFVMGLVDDRLRLPAWPKLAAQFAAGAVAVWGLGLEATFFVPVAWVNQVGTLLWIVAITNAFNFMDNMDGLTAGVAVIVLAVLVIVTAAAGQVFVPVLAVVLLGALVGFLAYNFPPASVFLGDAGSQPLGFLVAVLTVMANYYRGEAGDSQFSPFLPLVLLAVPLYDLTSVTLIRLARGQSPFVGDTNHFSHRLAALGLSRRAAVLTIYLATAATALGSLMLRHATTVEAVLVFAQTLCIVAVIAVFERIAGERVLKE